MNRKAVIKGILKKHFPALNKIVEIKKKQKTRNPARYYYSVYLRHLVRLNKHRNNFIPEVVAEIGPGSSLGVGLTALLTGSTKYYGFDVIKLADTQRNLEVFEDIYKLITDRAPIPDQDEFPAIHPFPNSYTFPSEILTDELLEKALNKERKKEIIKLIQNYGVSESIEGLEINYVVPWENRDQMKYSNVDLIISQATMEHVLKVDKSYQAMYQWLNPGGFISHQIDFKSHKTHKKWYGHWTIPEYLWKYILIARGYPLNRLPHSYHINLIEQQDFIIKDNIAVTKMSNLNHNEIKMKDIIFTDSDLNTSGAYISAQK